MIDNNQHVKNYYQMSTRLVSKQKKNYIIIYFVVAK